MAQAQIETPQQPDTSVRLTLARHVRARIAAAARVDPRTVGRYLDGLKVQPKNRDAIEENGLPSEGWRKADDGTWRKTIVNSLDRLTAEPTLTITRTSDVTSAR